MVFRMMGGKEDMNKIWPLREVQVEDTKSSKYETPSREWWDKMKAAQVKIDQQINEQRNGRN